MGGVPKRAAVERDVGRLQHLEPKLKVAAAESAPRHRASCSKAEPQLQLFRPVAARLRDEPPRVVAPAPPARDLMNARHRSALAPSGRQPLPPPRQPRAADGSAAPTTSSVGGSAAGGSAAPSAAAS